MNNNLLSNISTFKKFGSFTQAGLKALQVAIEEIELAWKRNFIPIASLVVGRNKKILAGSEDLRESFGENPVYSHVMLALGKAGSHINLRDTALFVYSKSKKEIIDESLFGEVSLGACQLFKPGYIASNKPLAEDLKKKLKRKAIKTLSF